MRHLILGNGGFTELSLHGRCRTDAATYVKAVRRYATEIGHLDWAAPRDRMTEDHVLARTGLSLRTHQHLTVVDYLRLRDLDPKLPFIPVLQGQSITDYHRCADLCEQRGVDLAALPLVGVGSVCRPPTHHRSRADRALPGRSWIPPARLRREDHRPEPLRRSARQLRLRVVEPPRPLRRGLYINSPQRVQLCPLRTHLAPQTPPLPPLHQLASQLLDRPRRMRHSRTPLTNTPDSRTPRSRTLVPATDSARQLSKGDPNGDHLRTTRRT